MPKGNLQCSHNGKYLKWYVNDGKNRKYIAKKNEELIKQLSYKKYLSLQLQNINQEQRAIEAYLKNHDSNAIQKETEFVNSTDFGQFLIDSPKTYLEELKMWQNEPYVKNEYQPEALKHKTRGGIFVRSKSEALIATMLQENNIPFRYECELNLNGAKIYPDFKIIHPIEKRIILWEHFGMIDKPDYQQRVMTRLHLLMANGYIPTINLITTYETTDNPLDPEKVQKTIDYYFG